MKPVALKMKYALALALSGILTAGPVLADKPDSPGSGRGNKNERADKRDKQRSEHRNDDDRSRRDNRGGSSNASRDHFEDRHRTVVREYYAGEFRGGRCPPGLAKKHNGCMPPGQAKKWHVGQPLPREVIYYSVPQPLVVQIGTPPSGHRYVRVASDILMIAIGTGMVVSAIEDLGR